MWESVNIKKAAPGPLKATLNPGAARNRKPKAELILNVRMDFGKDWTLKKNSCIIEKYNVRKE